MAYEVSDETMASLRGGRAVYLHATWHHEVDDVVEVTCEGESVTAEVVGVNGVDMHMRSLVLVRMAGGDYE